MEFRTGRINRYLSRICPVDRCEPRPLWLHYLSVSRLQSQPDVLVIRVHSPRSSAATEVVGIARLKQEILW